MESSWAYLAGFFDGDGSLHFQIVRQAEYRFGFYIRPSLVFYQSTSCEEGLIEIQNFLGGGRLRRRSGGMSDLTVTNRDEIRRILTEIEPFVVFKEKQVRSGLRLLDLLPPPKDPAGFLEACEAIDDFASLNFSKSRSVTAETVRVALRDKGVLIPVTTDPQGETAAPSGVDQTKLQLP
jgi:hypothetical protein